MTRAVKIAALAGSLIAALGLGMQSPAQAIIGGSPAPITDGPWEVVLVINGSNLCGGALASPTVIVTAAHCFVATRDISKIEAHAGITALAERGPSNRLPIASLVVHPGFDNTTYTNDVAVLTLSSPAPLSSTVGTIVLPYGLDAATWPAAGTPARIAGWGVTDKNAPKPAESLNAATVSLLTSPGGACGRYGSSQPPNILCAGLPTGGVDTCQGDSGSPLVVTVNGRAVLAGVTSTGAECAQTDYPGVYTSVPAMLSWITQFVPPQGNTVALTSPGAGQLAAAWNFADIATPVSSFTATFTSANAPALTCSSAGASCTVTGARKGGAYTVSVEAAVPTGTAPVGQAGPVVAAFGSGAAGTTIAAKRLKTLAALTGLPSKVVSSTKSVCVTKGANVRLLTPGTCTVAITSKGRTKVVSIGVTAR